MVRYKEEIIRTPDGVLHQTKFPYNRKKEKVVESGVEQLTMLANHFTYAALDHEVDLEAGEYWTLRHYPIPDATRRPELAQKRFREIFADLKEFGASVAYVTKDSSFTAISFRNSDGTPRLWDPEKEDLSPNLRKFGIRMGAKIMKRLSPLGSPTYLNGEFTVVFVDDDEYHAPQEGVIFVKVTDLPENEKFKVDGECYARPHVTAQLIKKMVERIMNDPNMNRAERRAKARELQKHMSKQYCHLVRGITGRGETIKGDLAEVARDEYLNVDLLVDRTNMKSEFFHNDPHTIFLQMFPQEQSDEVVTNRQTLNFYDWLFAVRTPVFGPSLGLVKDALVKKINELSQTLRNGKLMFHIDSLNREKDDPIRNNFVKVEKWFDAGFDLNDSLFLTQTIAYQVVQMLGSPRGEDDRKRRFPAPYAKRVSLRSEHTVKMRYQRDPSLAWNEAYVDPAIGLVVSDAMFEIIAETLGGADKDDHVEVHFRIATDHDEFFGIEPGDVTMAIIRNPVGVASDGERVGMEYWVCKATEWQAAEALEVYGDLPEIEMEKRPLCTAEMEFPAPAFTPTPQTMPDEYTKKFFVDQVLGASKAKGVYGGHANLAMAFAHYGIPFPFVAHEETFIDVCSQYRNPDDLARIRQLNDRHRMLLEANLEAADPWILKRIGLLDSKSVRKEPGLFTELVDFHRSQQRRFVEDAKQHIRALRESLAEEYADHSSEKVPQLIKMTKIAEERYRKENDLGDANLSHYQFEDIGNYVVDRLTELENNPESKRTPDHTLKIFREAHGWIFTQVEASRYQNPGVHQMYRKTDQQLMMGAMLDKLIEALSQSQS